MSEIFFLWGVGELFFWGGGDGILRMLTTGEMQVA